MTPFPNAPTGARRAGFDFMPAAIFLCAAVLYWFTSARSPGWVDATLILDSARTLQIGTFAITHNLFNLLGHLWLQATPFLDPHRSLTLLCALFGSLTVMFLYLAAREVTGSKMAASLAALAAALSQSLWWHSTMIEVYTLNTVLIAAVLYLVFGFSRRGGSWRLCAASFCIGLGISNHLLMFLFAAAFAVYAVILAARRKVRVRAVLLMALCAAAGASVFIYAFARDASLYGVMDLLRRMIAPEFGSKMFPAGLTPARRLFWLLNYLLLLLWNFPSAAVVFSCLGFKGLFSARRDTSAGVFYLIALAVLTLWSANYLIWDMYAFSLPVYIMLAVPMAHGIEAFLRRGKSPWRLAVLLTFLLPFALYPTFSRWPLREKTIDRYISLYPEAVRLGGYWDPAEYIFNPVKRDYRAVEEYAAAWAEALPPGACFWDDESKAAQPLLFYYQRVRGVRTDVDIRFFYSLAMDEDDFRGIAEDIRFHMSLGRPVFISSLAVPEREVLNQLDALESPETPVTRIRSLSDTELVGSFPWFRVVEVPLGPGLPSIYRLGD